MLKLGRDFVLLVNDGLSYARVEAQRSTSLSISSESVDSTVKGESWRDILQGAGINSAQVTLSGVASNSPMYMLLLSKKIAREHIDCRIDDTVGAFLVGIFKIVSIAASGTHNGEETYDIVLDSTGLFGYPTAGNAWQWDSGDDVLWDGGDMVLLESA